MCVNVEKKFFIRDKIIAIWFFTNLRIPIVAFIRISYWNFFTTVVRQSTTNRADPININVSNTALFFFFYSRRQIWLKINEIRFTTKV